VSLSSSTLLRNCPYYSAQATIACFVTSSVTTQWFTEYSDIAQ